jgi:hypothetical protein
LALANQQRILASNSLYPSIYYAKMATEQEVIAEENLEAETDVKTRENALISNVRNANAYCIIFAMENTWMV